tara:strand:+ start:1482 stop:1736 length:255 start_codon:yes stop_codon:yes gene_type:complete
MKNFDERSLTEKLKIILEESDDSGNHSLSKELRVKFLIAMPLLIFILIGIILNTKEALIGIFPMLFVPVACIFIGVLLYFYMMS